MNEIFCSAQISQLPILSYGCMNRSTTKSCPLEGAPLGFAPDSLQNNWLALKKICKDKHASLLCNTASDEEAKFL